MYESFYGLSSSPFRLAPDPRFFFESATHKRGLAYLRYGLHQAQGFVVVTGVPGTGKSMLVKTLLSELPERQMVIANIANTNLEADDVLRSVASQYGVLQAGASKSAILVELEKFFLAQHQYGKRVLLIIDEAQNLPSKSLEELRMLSNFQKGDQALLQIILLGQQQLRKIMADPDMEQLSQRVIASCHLKPMNAVETRGYIEHRLLSVDWQGDPRFSKEALGLIYKCTQGVPRLINIFCDRMLLAASLESKHEIDGAHVQSVADELQDEATSVWSNEPPSLGELEQLLPLPEAGTTFHGSTAEKNNDAMNSAGSHSVQAPEARNVNDINEAITKKPLPPASISARHVAVLKENVEIADNPLPEVEAKKVPEKKNEHEPDVREAGRAVQFSDSNVVPLQGVRVPVHADEVKTRQHQESEKSEVYQSNSTQQLTNKQPQKKWIEQSLLIGAVSLLSIAATVFLLDGEKFESLLAQQDHQPIEQTATAASALGLEDEPFMVDNSDTPVFPDDHLVVDTAPAQSESPDENNDIEIVAPRVEEKVEVKPKIVKSPEKKEVVISQAQEKKMVPTPVEDAPPKPKLVVAEKKPVANKKEAVKEEAPEKPLANKSANKAVAKTAVASDKKQPKKDAVAKPFIPQAISVSTLDFSSTLNPGKATVFDITKTELTDFIYKLSVAYEEGNLSKFTNLFVDDAVVDNTSGRAAFTNRYKDFFGSTEIRKIEIAGIKWNIKGDTAIGKGGYSSTLSYPGDKPAENEEGTVSFEVVKQSGRLLIKKMVKSN